MLSARSIEGLGWCVYLRVQCTACGARTRPIRFPPRHALFGHDGDSTVSALRAMREAVGAPTVAHHAEHLEGLVAALAAVGCRRVGAQHRIAAPTALGPLVVWACDAETLVQVRPAEPGAADVSRVVYAADPNPMATLRTSLGARWPDAVVAEAASCALAWREWRVRVPDPLSAA